ncbi:MAG: hypothetical protein JXX14_01425, partial [Deltaproteobacteria bacterium]|nr:hypothetical protein [Deltaproteobacteria bacterium]
MLRRTCNESFDARLSTEVEYNPMKPRRTDISTILLIAFCFVPGSLTFGCATSVPAVRKTIPKPPKPDFATVEIPSEITAGNVFELETTAFSLRKNNPQRQVLRDKIVKYHMILFAGMAEDDTDGRLDQFRLVLALHDPSDFRSGNISAEAAPMAEWIVKQFEPQGKEALVLAGLSYLSMAHPDNSNYEKQLMALLEWSENVRGTIRDPIERYGSISAMYADAAAMVPHREILNRLAVALAQRQRAVVQFLQIFAGQKEGFSPLMFHSVISRGGIGKEFVHAWFMGGYLNEVLEKMKELEVIDGIEEDLLAVLSQIHEQKNLAYNYHRLASQILGPGDPVAGMRACMNALHLEPNEPRYSLCVGRFLSNMDRQVAAVEYFARAVEIDSGAAMVQAMELVQDSLYRLHMDEKREEILAALSTTEKIVERVTEKADDDEEIAFAAAALIETAAIIEYDDGEIVTAEKWFKMAHDLWPSRPTPITKIAEIYYWRGEYPRAIKYLTQAMNARDKPGGAYADYWRAMLYEQRGDCHWA